MKTSFTIFGLRFVIRVFSVRARAEVRRRREVEWAQRYAAWNDQCQQAREQQV